MGNFVSYDNASDIVTAIGQKLKTLEGGFIFRGTVTFANLPSNLTKAMTGYVYNISTPFDTDARFIEGSGYHYPSGVDVAIANIGTDETPNMKFDVLGSVYASIGDLEQRVTDVRNMIATQFARYHMGGYAVGDIVAYGDALYKFTSTHTEGDEWDSSEVTAITIEEALKETEPASLTTAQVTALLALL